MAGRPAPDAIAHLGGRADITVRGRIEGFPVLIPAKARWQGVLACRNVDCKGETRRPVSGRILFILPAAACAYHTGDYLQMRGTLQGWDRPTNPGEFDYSRFMYGRGIQGRLVVHVARQVQCLRTGKWWSFGYWLSRVRGFLLGRLQHYLDPEAQGLAAAMLLGERSNLREWDKAYLAASGLAHVAAVSGLHTGVVFLLLMGIGRLLTQSTRLGAGAGLLGIWVFGGLTGGAVPVLRACVMLTCISAGHLVWRKTDPLSGLGLAGLLLLTFQPTCSSEAGFQLSYGATLALLVFMPKCWKKTGHWKAGAQLVLQPFLAAAVILLVISPLTLFHFYMFTPASLLANMMAVPLLSVAVVCGLGTGLAGGICPWLAAGLGKVCTWAVLGIKATSCFMLTMPGGLIYGWKPAPWVIVMYYSLLVLGFYSRRFFLWVVLAVLIFIVVYSRQGPEKIPPNEMRVTFLSLGIGESALLETGQGLRLLIDVGTEKEFFWRIRPLLASRGIQQLDAVVVSHTDADHAGGLKACAAFFQVKLLIHGGIPCFGAVADNSSQPACLDHIAQRVLFQGESLSWGKNLKLSAVWPPAGKKATTNAYCLAVLIDCPGGRLFFPGDCPGWIERQWHPLPQVKIFKAGHHGDQSASDQALLSQLCPELAVVTPGRKNMYGFPSATALERIRSWSRWTLNTAEAGCIEAVISPGKPVIWYPAR
ncbi:DNA internalization-related competence protein ComEC/Rec2 [candidate division FCPU426 bacterium]|nr:DNA internalization-related competence protein ComEC/Rec2 [candidate division FCPU426 bacterium]